MKKIKTVTCQNCGEPVQAGFASSVGARTSPFVVFNARQMTPDEIDATVIPLKHALHIAAPAGILTAILFVINDPSLSHQAQALGGGLAVSCTAFIAVRAVAAVKNWEHLGWKLEQMFKIDLNRDRVIGEPQPQPEEHNITTSITVQERAPNGKISRIKTLDWPCNPDEVEGIAGRILGGKLAETDWGKGKLASVRKFKRIRESLIKNGYAYWRGDDHTLGWDLTGAGRHLLDLPTPLARA